MSIIQNDYSLKFLAYTAHDTVAPLNTPSNDYYEVMTSKFIEWMTKDWLLTKGKFLNYFS